MSVLYALGVGPLRLRLAPGTPFPMGKAALFATGIFIFFLTVASPLHLLAEVYLVSAHMLQLSLLIYVVPPLLLWGTPRWLLEPLLTHRNILPLARRLTRPVAAFIVFHVVLVLWHTPAAFRLILFDEVLHGLGYIAIFAAALLMWWPIMGDVPSLPRPSYGWRLVYLSALLFAHLPLAGVISFASAPLYPWYARTPQPFGLSPLADQQLGGAIMGLFNLLALLTAICVVALKWLEAAEGTPSSKRQSPG